MQTQFTKKRGIMQEEKKDFKLKRFQNVEARTTTNRKQGKEEKKEEKQD